MTLLQPRQIHVLVLRQEASGFTPSPQGLTITGKRGTGFSIDLPAGENDVLHALTVTGGLPGLDAYDEVVIQHGCFQDREAAEALRRQLEQGGTTPVVEARVAGCVRIPLHWHPGAKLPFGPDDVVLRDGDVVLLRARDEEVFFTGGLMPSGEHVLPRPSSSASLGAGVCRSLPEAHAALERDPDLVFQELIEGAEVSVDAFISARGCCTVRVPRLRVRVIGGEAVQSCTIRDASVAELADRTIAALTRCGYQGPINLQLFTGTRPVLIEVNARLGSASVLSNQATGGRLFAAVVCEACGGVSAGDPDGYRANMYMLRGVAEAGAGGQQPGIRP